MSVSVLYNNAIEWHTKISVTHAHIPCDLTEKETENARVGKREREGGSGLIGFLWLQLNNIMHILA